MQRTTIVLAALASLAAAGHPAPSAASAGASEPYHITLSRRGLGPGEPVELKLVPPVPAGTHVAWSVASGKERLTYSMTYRAPYVIPVGARPVIVSVGISGPRVRTTVSTEIELIPGRLPGAEDCLGPGQSFATDGAGIVPDYVHADELPNLVHYVEPVYPRSDLARGIEDTIPVRALVCRSGVVLDAYALESFRNTNDLQPIAHDPELVDAAVAAARQFVFTPAIASGHPIATWITIPIPFRR